MSLRIVVPWLLAIGASIWAYVQWVLARTKREVTCKIKRSPLVTKDAARLGDAVKVLVQGQEVKNPWLFTFRFTNTAPAPFSESQYEESFRIEIPETCRPLWARAGGSSRRGLKSEPRLEGGALLVPVREFRKSGSFEVLLAADLPQELWGYEPKFEITHDLRVIAGIPVVEPPAPPKPVPAPPPAPLCAPAPPSPVAAPAAASAPVAARQAEEETLPEELPARSSVWEILSPSLIAAAVLSAATSVFLIFAEFLRDGEFPHLAEIPGVLRVVKYVFVAGFGLVYYMLWTDKKRREGMVE
ncbi:MAG: hypothetical protein AB1405_12045 [Bdellovibrionota bacterium]